MGARSLLWFPALTTTCRRIGCWRTSSPNSRRQSRRSHMKLRILIVGVVFVVTTLAADSGAELFQKAVTQERAAGNLEEAIKLYQRVAKEFASDRPLAAKALVQAARCYEKLGQDKAVNIYEQVARDYGDQRELAATANARLAVLRQGERAAEPVTMTQRKIEIAGVSGLVFSDGQRALY